MENKDNRTNEQKHKDAVRRMSMLLGFAAAMGAMIPDGSYCEQSMEEFDDELADMV